MNNTENSAAIKIEQSTDLNLKRTSNFNHQIPIPLQWKEIPSLILPQTTPVRFPTPHTWHNNEITLAFFSMEIRGNSCNSWAIFISLRRKKIGRKNLIHVFPCSSVAKIRLPGSGPAILIKWLPERTLIHINSKNCYAALSHPNSIWKVFAFKND